MRSYITDRNGTEIMIGDKVKAIDTPNHDYIGVVRYNPKYGCFEVFRGNFPWDAITLAGCSEYDILERGNNE